MSEDKIVMPELTQTKNDEALVGICEFFNCDIDRVVCNCDVCAINTLDNFNKYIAQNEKANT